MSRSVCRVDDDFIEGLVDRYAAGKRVRRRLPGEGRLHIDRPLPFLFIRHREEADASPVDRLVMTQASYLVAGGTEADPESLRRLYTALAEEGRDRQGGFLLVEVWESHGLEPDAHPALAPPAFTVACEEVGVLESTVRRLSAALERIEVRFAAAAEVHLSRPGQLLDRGYELIGANVAELEGVFWLGVGVRPIYRRPDREGEDGWYPMVLLDLEIQLAGAFLEAAWEFCRAVLDREPAHPQVLGRRALVRATWNIDRRLVEVSDSFEFLRLVTPINELEAWREFSERGFERPPLFRYAPLPVDVEAIKRTLFNLPIEKVEDPTLARLFREKQEELDKRLNMLRSRDGRDFYYGSLQLYGPVEDGLHMLAEQLLSRLPSHERDDARGGYLPAEEVARLALEEIDSYRAHYEDFPRQVELRDDIPPGMMVSHDRLLICTHSRFANARLEALLQHEIGTHLLTRCNGRAQRLRLLWAGLPGHDALQEGLAVLSEFLVGGLSRPRLRMLAARVVICRALTEGDTFIEAFERLVDGHGFAPRVAFTIVTRIYRSGGLTKDAVYLLGLTQILEYLGTGGRIEPLFVGKIASHHLADMEELERRGVLRAPPLLPNYLDLETAGRRLDRVREGMEVLDLIDEADRPAA